jgi:hypothetical protein
VVKVGAGGGGVCVCLSVSGRLASNCAGLVCADASDARPVHHRCNMQNFMAVLTASGGRHHFPTYASLLRHAACHKLAAADSEAVLQLAADQVGAWGCARVRGSCCRGVRNGQTQQLCGPDPLLPHHA